MLQILADESATLQNVYAPLPLGIHVVFCIIATAVYAALFARRKTYNYLCLMAAVDLTLMTQFFTDDPVIAALFIIEVGLLAASAIYSFRASRKKKLEAKQGRDPEPQESDDNTQEDTGLVDSDDEDDDIL